MSFFRKSFCCIILPLFYSLTFAQSPGLINPDDTPHQIHTPNPVTGKTINVLDFGADTSNNASDDRPAIQAAINSATYGDEIYFPNGVYNFNSESYSGSKTHINLKSGVNLRGESRELTILKSGFDDLTIDRFLKMRSAHDIVIENFTITSVWNRKYSVSTDVNNPEAGGPKYMISIEESSGLPSYNITVDSVLVEKYRVHGVRLSNSHDVVVQNSVFKNATDVGGGGAGYGVSIQGDKQQDNHSKFNLVKNCKFLGPYIRHGVLLQYATHHNLVQNNYLEDTRLDAIDLHGEDEYLNEIFNNEVRNVPRGAGVGVGNTGSTHDASGPFNFIHHNKMINCREGVKVYLGSPDTRIENNEVTGSNVSSGKGIYILNGPRTIIKSNKIYNNSGSDFTGIYLQYDGGTNGKGKGNPEDVQIIENQIFENDYGIRIYAGERIVLENNDVHDNRKNDIFYSSNVTFENLINITIIGNGSVQFDPSGGSYPAGTIVKLYAKRGANYKFHHWEGDLTGNQNPDSLLVDQSKKVTAVFELDPSLDEVSLTTNIIGNGRIILNPPGGIYDRGTTVTVTAVPDSGWKFTNWSGDLSGETRTDSLLLDSDKIVQANFERAQSFSIAAWVIGSGQVIYDPPGGTYLEGTWVKITALADNGWTFSNWGGDLSGNSNPDSVFIDSNKAFIVTFTNSTDVTDVTNLPLNYKLEQNYPNPFNNKTVIAFHLPTASMVNLTLFNAKGQKVAGLLSGPKPPGVHRLVLDAGRLPSGTYFYKLETDHFSAIKKMLYLR